MLRNRVDALEILDWLKYFKIAMGSAKALAFLHHGFIPHIIHRDMKSSNILLDADFQPRVVDFGLACLISACETHVSRYSRYLWIYTSRIWSKFEINNQR